MLDCVHNARGEISGAGGFCKTFAFLAKPEPRRAVLIDFGLGRGARSLPRAERGSIGGFGAAFEGRRRLFGFRKLRALLEA
jgi:hypothetical protein